MKLEMGGKASGSLIDFVVTTVPMLGEANSGDRSLVVFPSGGCLIAAVDGLGHGTEAAAAAERAIATLEAFAHESVLSSIRRCHDALRGTRGAVLTLAYINGRDETMTWLGVGNVEAVLLRADPAAIPPREDALLRGGVLGYQIPQLRASVVSLSKGDTVIFATDGISSGFADRIRVNDSLQQIADHICATHKKANDDALVLVARFRGSTE